MDTGLPYRHDYWQHYWGKYSSQGERHHLLVLHSLDVAAVLQRLLSRTRLLSDIAELLDWPEQDVQSLLVYLAAIHDLGKFFSAFQQLRPFPSAYTTTSRLSYNAQDAKHDRLGGVVWAALNSRRSDYRLHEVFALGKGECRTFCKVFGSWFTAAFSHHGDPKPLRAAPQYIEDYAIPENLRDVFSYIQDVNALFAVPWQRLVARLPEDIAAFESRVKQASWYIAGLMVLADWIGSNEQFFPYLSELLNAQSLESTPKSTHSTALRFATYWQTALQHADHALASTQILQAFQAKPFVSVEAQFNYSPTPLQAWAASVTIDNSPQLFILEDQTGAGKTEAALILTQRLMAAGAADGFYFGLPTRATSNAMYQRIAEAYLQMFDATTTRPSLVLSHSSAQQYDNFLASIAEVLPSHSTEADYASADIATGAVCNTWLADNRKKALLAPVSVGTIDQALMAALPLKHQSLRLLGCYRKVLIFDEVHASDVYAQELIKSVLQMHARHGGSAVLLTATLPNAQREAYLSLWRDCIGQDDKQPKAPDIVPFPLASVASHRRLQRDAVACRDNYQREVAVEWLHEEDDVIRQVLAQAEQGHSVVWVRNAVQDAITAYETLQAHIDDAQLLLFHSRFTLVDRQNIEASVLSRLGKSSTAAERRGFVLVTTQVFQESIDADCDVMFSDLCPIDDLIQRIGRLQRHHRDSQGQVCPPSQASDCRSPRVMVFAPPWQPEPTRTWGMNEIPAALVIYGAALLWKTQRVLQACSLRLPDNARRLIERVFGANVAVPEGLLQSDYEARYEAKRKAAKADYNQIDWERGYFSAENTWRDEHLDYVTRDIAQPTQQIILVQQDSHGEWQPIAAHLPHAIACSTVTLSIRYIEKHTLTLLEGPAMGAFIQRYPAARFCLCWDYGNDSDVGYCCRKGVFIKTN